MFKIFLLIIDIFFIAKKFSELKKFFIHLNKIHETQYYKIFK
jgi:hypothetical protein